MEKIRETKPDMDICENQWERLMIEKNLLGVYATRHPITLFPSSKECGAVEIKRLQRYSGNQNVTVIGIVSDFSKCKRKLDGEEMAFFKLSDSTGEIEVCCFVEAYKKVKGFLKEDTVIKVIGKLMNDKGDGTKKISVCMAEQLKPKDKAITVYAKLYLSGIDEEHGGFWDVLKPYVSRHGNSLKVYDTLMDEFRDTDFLVFPAILQDERIRSSFREL